MLYVESSNSHQGALVRGGLGLMSGGLCPTPLHNSTSPSSSSSSSRRRRDIVVTTSWRRRRRRHDVITTSSSSSSSSSSSILTDVVVTTPVRLQFDRATTVRRPASHGAAAVRHKWITRSTRLRLADLVASLLLTFARPSNARRIVVKS